MKFKIQNLNQRSIGFKGRYFPAISQKSAEGDMELLNAYINKEGLTVKEVEDINFTLNLTDLQKIAKINGVKYSGLTKEELKQALKGEVKEEGDD